MPARKGFHDPANLKAHFMSRVQVEQNGCWRWLGCKAKNGYGRLTLNRKALYAHRYAYCMFKGEIPEGLDLDHLCRTRDCVNPAHLEPVTRQVNLLRGETIVASASKATCCPKGHPYLGRNLILKRDGSRACRSCSNIRDQQRYERLSKDRVYVRGPYKKRTA